MNTFTTQISNLIKNNKNIFLNILGAFLVKGGSMILSVFLLPAYIKFFGDKSVLGIWYTILSVLTWVLMFDLGVGNGMRNLLPKAIANNEKEYARKIVSSTYFSTICFVFIVGILGELLIQILNWNSILSIAESELNANVLRTALRIAFFGVLIQFVLKLITSILYAIQKSAIVNLLILFSNVVILSALKILPPGNPEDNMITMAWVNVVAVNIPLLIVSILLFATRLRYMMPSYKFVDSALIKKVLNVGVTLLWLQLVFMIISSTNEFLISAFCSPKDVVEYQVYFKIFNSVASICSLALIPIWSAVTKAQAEKNYKWINKTYSVLMLFSIVVFVAEIVISFILQPIVDVWLGDDSIRVSLIYALIFSVSSWIFVVHNVNTSIGNGMSFFKPQLVFMTLAAIVDIPLAWIMVKICGGWIGIVIANIIALIPFEIVQPIKLKAYIMNLIYHE